MSRILFHLKFEKDMFVGLTPMIIISTAGHIVFIFCAVIFSTFFPERGHSNDLMFRVSLTSLPSPQSGISASPAAITAKDTTPKPASPPAKKKETVSIRESKKNLPQPKKQEKKSIEKEAERTVEHSEGKELAESVSPISGIGDSGMSGSISGNASGVSIAGGSDFEYAWYRATIMSKLKESWIRPVTQLAGNETLQCTISFNILRNGSIADLNVEQSSGYPALDRSAARAVQDSSPLPPLPYQFKEPFLKARFIFELNPE